MLVCHFMSECYGFFIALDTAGIPCLTCFTREIKRLAYILVSIVLNFPLEAALALFLKVIRQFKNKNKGKITSWLTVLTNKCKIRERKSCLLC